LSMIYTSADEKNFWNLKVCQWSSYQRSLLHRRHESEFQDSLPHWLQREESREEQKQEKKKKKEEEKKEERIKV